MIISFDTINFSWETEKDAATDKVTNNLVILLHDVGTLPVDETARLTLEQAIKVAIGKVVNDSAT